MKLKPIIILLLNSLLIWPALSQNLVPNYSFEIHTDCPFQGSEIDFATPWYGPTSNSTDYFNYCDTIFTPTTIGLPPHTGDAYSAIWVFNPGDPNYKEYLQVALTDTLKADSCYYVEFFVALHNNVKYAINTDNISAHFSDQAIWDTGTGYVLNLVPHIQMPLSFYLTDTLWARIYGTYLATGGETHLTIGNFKTDANTDTLATNYGNYYGSYYFIDDVTVQSTCFYMSTQPDQNTIQPVIYPNPVADVASITLSQPLKNGKIQLINTSGQVMKEISEINSAVITFESGNLASGMYFVAITDSDHDPVIVKLIIRK